jgi:hypothetical protein
VRQQSALGHARRARRIDDDGGVVRLARRDRAIHLGAEFGLALRAQRGDLLERHEPVALIVAHALHVDAHDMDEVRKPALVGTMYCSSGHGFVG